MASVTAAFGEETAVALNGTGQRRRRKNLKMRYRKKPVTVEAVVWTGDNFDELKKMDGFEESSSMIGKELWVMTMEGPLHASVGDYIIRGINGEFYPCKPDIFMATYEEAEKVVEMEEKLMAKLPDDSICHYHSDDGITINADFFPLVRCYDCFHSQHWYKNMSMCFLWDEDGIEVFNDGFCNYGKKREDKS